MKQVFSSVLFALFVIACTCDFASAQRQGGQRGGFGFGGGGNQGDYLCDSLVLNADRAAKVNQIYEDVSEAMRQNMGDFQNMSQEERRTAFTQMQEKRQAALTEKLASVLSKEELEAVKPLLGMRGGRPSAEIRALRQIEINDETRAKLQTVVLIYENTMAALRPQFTPGQGGPGQGGPGQGGQRGGGGISEENRTKMEQARESLTADIKKVLTPEQVQAWTAQTEKVQAEMESQRPQRGGGQGGGQGRGQGRGQGQ